jgi:hypothetical protein
MYPCQKLFRNKIEPTVFSSDYSDSASWRPSARLTDTSDTVLLGNVAPWGNYRNWNRSSDSACKSLFHWVLSCKYRIHRQLRRTAVIESLPLRQTLKVASKKRLGANLLRQNLAVQCGAALPRLDPGFLLLIVTHFAMSTEPENLQFPETGGDHVKRNRRPSR